jgi:tetratricopeptide (TPR) repeat protein
MGYDETCRIAFDRFVENDRACTRLVELCLLTPMISVDLRRLSGAVDARYAQRGTSGHPYLAKGICDYRHARYDEALQCLPHAYKVNTRRTLSRAFLAMAYYRVGDLDNARATLERAENAASRAVPDINAPEINSHEPDTPIMRVMVDIVHAEARSLIVPDSAGAAESATPELDSQHQ